MSPKDDAPSRNSSADGATCPVLDVCGGCPWMNRSAQAQQDSYVALVVEALESQALLVPEQLSFVASPQGVAYRNRLRLKVGEEGRIGFFNPDKDLDCVVLRSGVRRLMGRLQQWAQSQPDEAKRVQHLEARDQDLDGRFGVFLVEREGHLAVDSCTVRSQLGDDVLVAVADQDLPMPTQRFALDDALYGYVPLNGFMQVNHGVNRLLRAHVVAGAKDRGVRRFADLYCGSGNLSLPLLHSGLEGRAVETHVGSVHAARRAAEEQGLDSAVFQLGDAGACLKAWRGGRFQSDLVVSNPPRAGMKEACEWLAHLEAPRLALCYFNPTSLAGDVARLTQFGYVLEEVALFDMFPHTRHVETVAWLTRC